LLFFAISVLLTSVNEVILSLLIETCRRTEIWKQKLPQTNSQEILIVVLEQIEQKQEATLIAQLPKKQSYMKPSLIAGKQ